MQFAESFPQKWYSMLLMAFFFINSSKGDLVFGSDCAEKNANETGHWVLLLTAKYLQLINCWLHEVKIW